MEEIDVENRGSLGLLRVTTGSSTIEICDITACYLDTWMGGADAVEAYFPIVGIQQMFSVSVRSEVFPFYYADNAS